MNVIEYLIDNIIEDFQTGELLHIRSILIKYSRHKSRIFSPSKGVIKRFFNLK